MANDYTSFQIPSYTRQESYDFEASDENYKVYEELNKISEEIEECRRRNC